MPRSARSTPGRAYRSSPSDPRGGGSGAPEWLVAGNARCARLWSIHGRQEAGMADTASGPEGPKDEASPGSKAGPGGKDTGKIHGAHGPARQRRSFRRKSGG